MFCSTRPASAEQAGLVGGATHAIDVLSGVLRRMHGESPAIREIVELDALYLRSTMHGLAGVMNGHCVDKPELQPTVLKQAVRHAIDRMCLGLAGKV